MLARRFDMPAGVIRHAGEVIRHAGSVIRHAGGGD